MSCRMWIVTEDAEVRHVSERELTPSSFPGDKVSWLEGICWRLTWLDSLLVLRLCCMDRDSAMSVTGLWSFFRSPLYFTCGWEKEYILALLNPFHILSNSLTSKHTMFLEVMWSAAAQVSTYLTSQHVGILQSLVNLTVLQVILWSLSFHLLVELFVVLHLIGKDIYIYIYTEVSVQLVETNTSGRFQWIHHSRNIQETT